MMMLLILTSVLGTSLKLRWHFGFHYVIYSVYGSDIAFCHRKFAGYYCNGALYMLYFNLGTDRSPLCK